MMAFGFRIDGRVLLIIAHFLYISIDHTTLAQDDPAVGAYTEPDSATEPVPDVINNINNIEDQYIEPDVYNENTDMFAYKTKEYLFVNTKVMHEAAETMCTHYSGVLASIPDLDLARFLADALSETNMDFESLWVGGRVSSQDNVTWNWIKNNYTDPVNAVITDLISNSDVTLDFDRNCLAFAREFHDKPQFKRLNCNVQRAFMCERDRGSGDGNKDSTHSGWIRIGARLYKIFREKVDYDTAVGNCFNADVTASLAVIDNLPDVKQLARYLLIGRPSLENAWIGARWTTNKYEFEAAPTVVLDNITNSATNFPPWRNNAMTKTGGCLLLDRHLADIPLFVEARCHRLRSYICSKDVSGGDLAAQKNYTETIMGNVTYRAYYTQQPWEKARDICIADKTKLAEPAGTDEVEKLLFVMGQNVSTFGHIWLGGKYADDKWVWDSTSNPLDEVTFPFVKNSTYIQNVEQVNTCLNLDRENHIVGIFYGTTCFYPQNFICQKETAGDEPIN